MHHTYIHTNTLKYLASRLRGSPLLFINVIGFVSTTCVCVVYGCAYDVFVCVCACSTPHTHIHTPCDHTGVLVPQQHHLVFLSLAHPMIVQASQSPQTQPDDVVCVCTHNNHTTSTSTNTPVFAHKQRFTNPNIHYVGSCHT